MRPRSVARLAALVALVAPALPAAAQPLADTLFAWSGYNVTSRCRVAVYPAPPPKRADDEDARTTTIVVRELAENPGPSTLDDARYLVEQVGRTLGVDPASAYWVFHWGGFSYGADRGKELFLRATFRRSDAGRLTGPSWRVLSREEVEEITDRRFRDGDAPVRTAAR